MKLGSNLSLPFAFNVESNEIVTDKLINYFSESTKSLYEILSDGDISNISDRDVFLALEYSKDGLEHELQLRAPLKDSKEEIEEKIMILRHDSTERSSRNYTDFLKVISNSIMDNLEQLSSPLLQDDDFVGPVLD